MKTLIRRTELDRATEEHANALDEYAHATNKLGQAKQEHERAVDRLNKAHRRLYAARYETTATKETTP